tara:strand:- start:737 stop:1012 length:276 start_codon:yes stop_codon:yes gene_type:complete
MYCALCILQEALSLVSLKGSRILSILPPSLKFNFISIRISTSGFLYPSNIAIFPIHQRERELQEEVLLHHLVADEDNGEITLDLKVLLMKG